MLIKTTFNVNNAKGVLCSASAYFYFQTREILKDYDGDYRSPSGYVTSWTNFTPLYENTRVNDLEIFTPYDELHLAKGKHSLKFQIEIQNRSTNTLITASNFTFFTVTQN